MKSFITICLLVGLALVRSEVYLEETFSDDSWEKNWIYSEHPRVLGKFVLYPMHLYNMKDKGLKASQDFRYYALSRKFNPFSNKDKALVVQYTIKYEEDLKCGGAYVKLFDCSLEQKDLHGGSPFIMMFGPDICGDSKGVRVAFKYKEEYYPIKKDIRCKNDGMSHLYTLVVRPDNTYEVLLDNEKVESGDLEEDWNFLPPKKIKDPEAKKPEDWDDRATIDDPSDSQPEDWDNRATIDDPSDSKPEDWHNPEHIVDPLAVKPEDWNDEMDGEWEPPQIPNPEYNSEWKPKQIDNPAYKGEWKPKQIDNPAYRGPWIYPEIDNPEYSPDPELYKKDEICAIGFEVWQDTLGTIFDNILITDDVEFARKQGEEVWRQSFHPPIPEFQLWYLQKVYRRPTYPTNHSSTSSTFCIYL